MPASSSRAISAFTDRAPRRVRGVLLDYGNVLARIDCVELAALVAEAGGAGDATAAGAAHETAFRAHDAAIAAGAGHPRAWRSMMAALVGAAWGSAVDDGAAAALVERIWERQRVRNLWRDVPGQARALVADLAAARVPLALVSNGEGTAAATLAEVGLAAAIPVVVDSAVVGVAKPDPRIFAIAAERLRIAAAELVHVGDSESADVAGAHAAGIVAIRFDGLVPNPSPTCAEARAATYADLRAELERLLARTLPRTAS